jgi:hypothetical protein
MPTRRTPLDLPATSRKTRNRKAQCLGRGHRCRLHRPEPSAATSQRPPMSTAVVVNPPTTVFAEPRVNHGRRSHPNAGRRTRHQPARAPAERPPDPAGTAPDLEAHATTDTQDIGEGADRTRSKHLDGAAQATVVGAEGDPAATGVTTPPQCPGRTPPRGPQPSPPARDCEPPGEEGLAAALLGVRADSRRSPLWRRRGRGGREEG